MGKSYTFVDLQVTDEGGRDYKFPECLFAYWNLQCQWDHDQFRYESHQHPYTSYV